MATRLYLVQLEDSFEVSTEIASELTNFGSVGLVSKFLKVYSLEMDPSKLPLVESLSFVKRVNENTKGIWYHKQ